jgi:hypothetical protein
MSSTFMFTLARRVAVGTTNALDRLTAWYARSHDEQEAPRVPATCASATCLAAPASWPGLPEHR